MLAGVLFFSIVAAGVAAWWLYRQQPPPLNLDRMIAGDVLGLLVVRDFPESLEVLEQTRLGKWFELQSDELRKAVPEPVRRQTAGLFDHILQSAWIALHELEKKDNGAWRIHFTAILISHPLQQSSLASAVRSWVKNLFGASETEIFEEGKLRIYRGGDPGEILYQLERPEFLLISNSEAGWKKTLDTLSGRRQSLQERPSFRQIRRKMGDGHSLFLYLRTGEILSPAPEFGYFVDWKGGQVVDRYLEPASE